MSRFAALREALTQRLPVSDVAFDLVYPSWAQAASARFWTPVRVALHAAALLKDAGAQTVLDVGSGVGKFAVIAGLAADLDVTGVEQRPHLVAAAQRAAERYRAPVRFICDRIEHIDPQAYDAYYLFNPFGENLAKPEERLDDQVTLSSRRFASDVELVERWLESAAVGTSILTYNGFGGRIPASYELLPAQPASHQRLRLWRKRSAGATTHYFVETEDTTRSLRGLPIRRNRPAG